MKLKRTNESTHSHDPFLQKCVKVNLELELKFQIFIRLFVNLTAAN